MRKLYQYTKIASCK